MVTVEKQDGIVTIQIPEALFNDELRRMIDQITFLDIVSKSKATEEDVEELALEAKKSGFLKLRERFRGVPEFDFLFDDEKEEEE